MLTDGRFQRRNTHGDGDIHTFRFSEEGVSNLVNGPVEVRAFADAGHTTPASAIAFYYGCFNEVVGSGL